MLIDRHQINFPNVTLQTLRGIIIRMFFILIRILIEIPSGYYLVSAGNPIPGAWLRLRNLDFTV